MLSRTVGLSRPALLAGFRLGQPMGPVLPAGLAATTTSNEGAPPSNGRAYSRYVNPRDRHMRQMANHVNRRVSAKEANREEVEQESVADRNQRTRDELVATMTSLQTHPFSQFFLPPTQYASATPEKMSVGRSWTASELRTHSYEDLHKLWFVLLKERNMLLTQRYACNIEKRPFYAREHLRKVRKSMARLKHVLGERSAAFKEARAILFGEGAEGVLPEESQLRIHEAISKGHLDEVSSQHVPARLSNALKL
ncbi:hypothetical protein H696_04351 [Fonticula alba]|uniref:Large ribosomal subunit protein uL29m n=1 Tax=Fonticula alba TaxID=691883 RepID=A0A058Z478_FONAL|nr:hypothetical protein H696_04351 [Fonticula alba]KCV68931.1 hypothetical protein H696_04351 [Fonticula alba]|eukprot:XP_009496502.1 hypothetical protein H696_04351 [Fonticula alba]